MSSIWDMFPANGVIHNNCIIHKIEKEPSSLEGSFRSHIKNVTQVYLCYIFAFTIVIGTEFKNLTPLLKKIISLLIAKVNSGRQGKKRNGWGRECYDIFRNYAGFPPAVNKKHGGANNEYSTTNPETGRSGKL